MDAENVIALVIAIAVGGYVLYALFRAAAERATYTLTQTINAVPKSYTALRARITPSEITLNDLEEFEMTCEVSFPVLPQGA